MAIGLARGKKSHDKRETLKKREADRETRAAEKNASAEPQRTSMPCTALAPRSAGRRRLRRLQFDQVGPGLQALARERDVDLGPFVGQHG